MVNRTIQKNAVREIVSQPGRYLAILGIIMLGAGFFVGLRVTQKCMVQTAETYLNDTDFYDFQLVSTLGYTQKQADAAGRNPAVLDAEAALQQDALVTLPGGDDIVISFHLLPSRINRPVLTDGRMPEAANETVLDARAQGYYKIGDEIELSALNPQDSTDRFTEKIFVITGFATSPLYLNYERGNTSLGTGTVTYYAYLGPDSFHTEYYTSIYVRCAIEGGLYSDAYARGIDYYEPAITSLAKDQAYIRFLDLSDQTIDSLNEAEDRYSDGLSAYHRERKDAEIQLSDAAGKLASAREELDRSSEALEAGKQELQQARDDAEKAFREAEDGLSDAVRTLSEKEQAYAAGLAEYQAGETAYSLSLQQYNASVEQYAKIFELTDLYMEFTDSLADVRSELSALTGEITEISLDEDLDASGRREKIREVWDASYDTLYTGAEDLLTASETLADRLETEFGARESIASFREGIQSLRESLEAAGEEEADLTSSVRALADTGRELYTGAAAVMNELSGQMENAKNDLNVARDALTASRLQLAAAHAQLEAARAALDEGWASYFAGVEELKTSREEAAARFADAEAEIAENEALLLQGEEDYAEGLQSLAEARKEAEKGFLEAEQALLSARSQIDEGWAAFEALAEPDVYVLGRWANVGYVCLESDSEIVRNVSKIFPVFFFLVAALICVTTMARMIDEQRGQLGVLLSLGYRRSAVMYKYFFYAGSAAILGCGIGIPLFSFLFPQIIWQAYRIMYNFSPVLEYCVDWPLFSVTTVLYIGAMMLVTWFSLFGHLNAMPANILRPKAPKLGKRVLLERIPFIWKRLSFMWKVTVRNIFRYKSRVFMMLLGVAGCTALMITGFGIRDSISDIVRYQYGEITLYEYEVTFTDPVTAEQAEAFSKVASRVSGGTVFACTQSLSVKNGKKESTAYLVSVPDGDAFSEYVSLHEDDRAVSYPGLRETVIDSTMASDLNVKPGDTVTVTLEGREYPLTVTDVFDNYIYHYVYITDETYTALTGHAPEKKTAYVLAREDAHDATARLLNQDGVINVTAGTQLKERIGSIMDNLIYIVILTIVCAAALAFIVIYNLININITERMREIATVKVLGFYPEESAIYVLRENILLTLLGALLGIPLGILLNRFVMGAIQVDLVSFTPRVKPLSFVWSVGLTILFSILVYIMMMRKLEKINMAAALKAAE